MVRIGSVWDSTTDVLAGRAGLLTPIAGLAFLLPSVVQAGIGAYGGRSPGIAALNIALALVTLAATLWGQLATVAVASDPATTRADAGRAAARRLPPALLVTLVLLAAAIVAVLPIVVVLTASGFDWQAAGAGTSGTRQPPVAVGAALFCFFYALLIFGVSLWLGARLFLLNPVILNERRGLGAIGRSMTLTRRLAFKLIGAILLFLIVLLVGSFAARSVVFTVLRLLLGSAHQATATFMGAVAAAAVTAAFTTVVSVFAARLYAAVGESRDAVATK